MLPREVEIVFEWTGSPGSTDVVPWAGYCGIWERNLFLLFFGIRRWPVCIWFVVHCCWGLEPCHVHYNWPFLGESKDDTDAMFSEKTKQKLHQSDISAIFQRLVALAQESDSSDVQYNCAGIIGQLALTGRSTCYVS